MVTGIKSMKFKTGIFLMILVFFVMSVLIDVGITSAVWNFSPDSIINFETNRDFTAHVMNGGSPFSYIGVLFLLFIVPICGLVITISSNFLDTSNRYIRSSLLHHYSNGSFTLIMMLMVIRGFMHIQGGLSWVYF